MHNRTSESSIKLHKKRNEKLKTYLETKPVNTQKKTVQHSRSKNQTMIGGICSQSQLNETITSQKNSNSVISRPIKISKKSSARDPKSNLSDVQNNPNQRNKAHLKTINNSGSVISIVDLGGKSSNMGTYRKVLSTEQKPQNMKSVSTVLVGRKNNVRVLDKSKASSISKNETISNHKPFQFKVSEKKGVNRTQSNLKTII